MRILFVLNRLLGRGAERASLQIASYLCSHHTVYLVLLYDDSEQIYSVDPRIERFELHTKQGAGPVRNNLSILSSARKLRELKEKLKIDVTVSFLQTADLCNVLSGGPGRKLVTVRNFYSERFGPDAELHPLIRRFLIRRIAKRADGIASVSDAAGRDLAENYGADPSKIVTICNFCDAEKIRKELGHTRSSEKSGETFEYITAGSLIRQKGHWHLLRAFARVCEKHPQARLHICGQEDRIYGGRDLSRDLRELAGHLGIGDKVIFSGFEKEIFRNLSRADCAVFTSLYEGMSNAMLEAMACGLPVISTDCHSGPREVLSPESDCMEQTSDISYASFGILTPPVDGAWEGAGEPLTAAEVALSEAMLRILEDEPLRRSYAKKSLERIRAFAPGRIMPVWEQFISGDLP